MKFAVTGGAGFIGSHIVKYLLQEGHTVKVIDNLCNNSNSNITNYLDQIDFYQEDIRDYEKVEKIIRGCDGIFHQAALTSVQESFLEPQKYVDVNVNGSRNIIKIAVKENIKVVYASSSSIYGNQTNFSIKENTNKNPINPYGYSKLEMENLFKTDLNSEINSIGLRYFNVYGIGQNKNYAGVITKFLSNINKNKPLVIFGDGTQKRDFIHVDDIVEANIMAMKSNIKNAIFNVGTGISTTINNLAELMIKISNFHRGIIHLPPADGDVKFSQADTDLIFSTLKWSSKIDLNTGINKLFLK